jgi:hypothetical protein
MASLFADENVPLGLVKIFRTFGHDVLTNNRRHFHQLHRQAPNHTGIITFTDDPDTQALAQRIQDAITAAPTLTGVLIRSIKPP